MTTSITHAGCKQLLFQRMLKAVISSIIVQFFFMSGVILITNFRITSPLSWITDTWTMITSLYIWGYFIILATVMVLQGIICSKNYLTARPYAESRFSMFCSLFTTHNFMVGGLYLTIGLVLVWLHLSLENGRYSSLTTHCSSKHGSCLVEEYLFLILGGLWTGLYYFIKTNILKLQNLQFPIIPLSIFSQVRRGIIALLPVTMASAIWPTIYFFFIYFLIGGCLRGGVASALLVNVENEPLDRVWSLMVNVPLIIHFWLYASLFALTMSSMDLHFQAYLTEWMQFEIAPGLYNLPDPLLTLPEALGMDRVPIIQHLGYLDLVVVAQKQRHRRTTLFTLSQPGGHPYNWNCVVEQCLGLLKKFSDSLNQVCACKFESKPLSPDATSLRPEKFVHQMRNLIAPMSPLPSQPSQTCTQVPVTNGQRLAEFLNAKKQNLIAYLLSKPLIFYFFGKQYDGKIQQLLIAGQPIIWAADAISSLAVASLTEDLYGIVQKDLPRIIETLLVLKQSLDKLYKMNMLARRPHQDDKDVRQMLNSLRSASKRSIYRIVINFKDYIDDIELEPSIKNQLHNFSVCKE